MTEMRPGYHANMKNPLKVNRKQFSTKFVIPSLIGLLISVNSCGSYYYYPTDRLYLIPEMMSYQKEIHVIKGEGGVNLEAWHIPADTGSPRLKKTILLQFHGNGENMTSHFSSLVWMVDYGYDLFAFDYRGYGISQGEPDRELIYKDSIKVLEYVNELAKKRGYSIIVYGQSLGGAVSLRAVPDMKDKSRLKLVVADSTFASYNRVARDHLTGLLYPLKLLSYLILTDDLSPDGHIKRISPVPLLVIHSRHDPTVYFHNGLEVYRNAAEPKYFMEVRGFFHTNWMLFGKSPDAKKLLAFFRRALSRELPLRSGDG